MARTYRPITFSDQLFHRHLVSTYSKHLPDVVAASSTRSTPETSALWLRHTRKLLHSCLLCSRLPQTDSSKHAKNAYKSNLLISTLLSCMLRAALLRCARHFSARGTQKGVAERFLISSKARWSNCIEVNRQGSVLSLMSDNSTSDSVHAAVFSGRLQLRWASEPVLRELERPFTSLAG